MNIYQKIMNDQGRKGQNLVNKPLSYYYANEENSKDPEFLSTGCIPINLAASGYVNKCVRKSGMTTICAPSRFGKSLLGLSLIKNSQLRNILPVVLITEGIGSWNWDLVKAYGIDTSKEKLVVFFENSIEELRNIIAKIFEGLTKEESENILLLIDSFGAIGSLQAVENIQDGKTTKDMFTTQLKNQFIIFLNSLKCTKVLINHVYAGIGSFTDVLSISGGSKIVLLSDSILVLASRAKHKNNKDEVDGWILTIKTYKSRFSIEGSEIKMLIEKSKGINPYFGILEIAMEAGVVLRDKGKGYYRPHIENDIYTSEEKLFCREFWEPIFKQTNFKQYLESKFQYENNISLNDTTTNTDNLFDTDLKSDTQSISDQSQTDSAIDSKDISDQLPKKRKYTKKSS